MNVIGMARPVRSLLSLIAVAAMASSACSGGEAAAEKTPAPPAGGARGGRGGGGGDVPVTVAAVTQKSVPVVIEGIGTVIAASTVSVRAQITGELTSVNFKEGEDVEKGQVLVTLDKRPLEASLHQTEATLQRDEAQLANAKSVASRYADLQQRGIATREQSETARTQAAALEATVAADKAAIESARVQLDYATIAAPIAGRTGLLQVHPGNLVRANDTTPIITINKITPVYVSFAIPEGQLSDLKRYMARGRLAIVATLPSEAESESTGEITFIDNAVDVTTGTIKVKGTFPNTDHRLWPGQYVNVRVTLTSEPRAVVVPTAAVQTGQQGPYVFVVKPDKTVEVRPVTVARASGSESVLAAGAIVGETVVTDGQIRLVPGSRVSIKQQ
ncbi:MAG TPA: efflux RND transporter periplasmic adaptor subunit [Vicinamibacterales bacterium]|nr:efflux RND transporter periplasmic adaptor subunit [Vicinamibacterales bacterium]